MDDEHDDGGRIGRRTKSNRFRFYLFDFDACRGIGTQQNKTSKARTNTNNIIWNRILFRLIYKREKKSSFIFSLDNKREWMEMPKRQLSLDKNNNDQLRVRERDGDREKSRWKMFEYRT